MAVNLFGYDIVVFDAVELFEQRVILNKVSLSDTVFARLEVASTMCMIEVVMDGSASRNDNDGDEVCKYMSEDLQCS